MSLEDKTACRLAFASAEVEFSECFGQFVFGRAVSGRYRRDRFKPIRHSVSLAYLLRRESGHLMNEQPERCRLHDHILDRETNVMERVAVRLASLVKVQLRN